MQYYDNKLNDMKEEINRNILNIRRTEGDDREQLIDDINKSFKDLRDNFKRFKRELKNLQPAAKAEWEGKKKQHIDEMNKLLAQFNVAKRQANRDNIMGPAETKEKEAPSKKKDNPTSDTIVIDEDDSGRKVVKDEKLEQELFKEVFAEQDKCIKLIDSMIGKADEAIEVNADSLAVIKAQNEQLKKINQEMDELGGNITLARKEFASLARRLATDKLIVVVICAVAFLVFLGLIGFLLCVPVGLCKYIKEKIDETQNAQKTESVLFNEMSYFCYRTLGDKLKAKLWS